MEKQVSKLYPNIKDCYWINDQGEIYNKNTGNKISYKIENDGYVFEVPEDCYLVMGDNRNDSYDARYWVNTYVTRDEIIGKAYFIYYPFSRFGSLYK